MHNGPVRFIYKGDPSIGQKYTRAARKIIGVWNTFSNAPTWKRKLPDGTIIKVVRQSDNTYTAIIDVSLISVEVSELEGIVLQPSSLEETTRWGSPFFDEYLEPINFPLGTANSFDFESISSILEYDTEWILNRYPEYQRIFSEGIIIGQNYGPNYWMNVDGSIILSLNSDRYRPKSRSFSYFYKGRICKIDAHKLGITGIAAQTKDDGTIRLITCSIIEKESINPRFILMYVDLDYITEAPSILPENWKILTTSPSFEDNEVLKSAWVFDRSGTKLIGVVDTQETVEGLIHIAKSTIYEITIDGDSTSIETVLEISNNEDFVEAVRIWNITNLEKDSSQENTTGDYELYSTSYTYACDGNNGWVPASTTWVHDCDDGAPFWGHWEYNPDGSVCKLENKGSPLPCTVGPDTTLSVDWGPATVYDEQTDTYRLTYTYETTISLDEDVLKEFTYSQYLYADYSHQTGEVVYLRLNESGERDYSGQIIGNTAYDSYWERRQWIQGSQTWGAWDDPIYNDTVYNPSSTTTENYSLSRPIELELSDGMTKSYISTTDGYTDVLFEIEVGFADLRNNVLIITGEKRTVTAGSDITLPIGDVYVGGIDQHVPSITEGITESPDPIVTYGDFNLTTVFIGSHAINNNNKYVFSAPYGIDPDSSYELWFNGMSNSDLVTLHNMTTDYPIFKSISMI